jgi:hypothetical protein
MKDSIDYARIKYAVEMSAYYGEPSSLLTDEEVAVWLALRAEAEKHFSIKVDTHVRIAPTSA